MDLIESQSSKVLLTLFVSVLVGFITAALSIVRLVNDKENKTTDYRQAWNDSLRKCFADLISNITLIAGCIVRHRTDSATMSELSAFALKNDTDSKKIEETVSHLREHLEKRVSDEGAHLRELRKNLHQSYALTALHFKPNDLSFSRIEQKYSVVIEMLDRLEGLKGRELENERLVLREKIQVAAFEITGYSRDILKIEWETVKKGERAYQQTKRWSLIGGGVALFILLAFGAVTAWSFARNGQSDSSEKGIPSKSIGNDKSVRSGYSESPAQQSNLQSINVIVPTDCTVMSRNESPSKELGRCTRKDAP